MIGRLFVGAVAEGAALLPDFREKFDAFDELGVGGLVDVADEGAETIVKIGLIPLRAEFRAVVDAGNAGHRKKKRVEVEKVAPSP